KEKGDFQYLDLTGLNLSLEKPELSGADLSYANLSGANLSGANLSWTYLSGAKSVKIQLLLILQNIRV
ncbi:MAG: pentapeptide repeat-containing protein, partial [Deltaproteobacteria bacterium]